MSREPSQVQINVTWLQTAVFLITICGTLFGGLWWLVGERTRYVLNEEFWASERIRPAMKLYISENTISRNEFTICMARTDSMLQTIRLEIKDLRLDVRGMASADKTKGVKP